MNRSKKRIYFLLIAIIISNCFSSCANTTNKVGENGDSLVLQTNQLKHQKIVNTFNQDSLIQIIDSLNQTEFDFINKISRQNDFVLITKKVRRFYSALQQDVPLYNELVYTDSLLENNGYVFMSFRFYNRIEAIEVTYNYSLGQAAVGYGSVVGNDFNDYIHSFKSCGLTNCLIKVFQAQKELFSKNISIN